MAALYTIRSLLWLLLSFLAFAIASVVVPGSRLTAFERIASVAVMLALALPLAWQLKTLHSRIREMRLNSIALDENGVFVRLIGTYRARKGLPMIEDLRLTWSMIETLDRQRRKFVYPSVIPMAYLLEVFVIRAGSRSIPFTAECVPSARKAAGKIAARLASREG